MLKRLFKQPQTKGEAGAYYACRAAIMYLLYRLTLSPMGALLRSFAGSFAYDELIKDVPLAAIIGFLVIPFAFYSFVRTFALTDRFGYGQTAALDGEDAIQKKVRYADALGTMPHLVTFFTVLALYLVLPLSFGYGFHRDSLGFGEILGATTEKTLFGGVLAMVYLFLIPLAQRSARREWQRVRAAAKTTRVIASMQGVNGFLKRTIGSRYLRWQLLLIFVLYSFGVWVAAVVISLAYPFLEAMFASPLSVLISLLGLVALVLLCCLPSLVRAIKKRAKLVRRIRRVCRERGYELSPIRRPILGMFPTRAGSDFTVKVGEKTYECKLLASVLPMAEMLFRHDGIVENSHGIRLYLMARAMYAEMSHSPRIHLYASLTDYTFTSEHQKILIVCPAAAQTLIVWGNERKPIDTGARIGDYFLYNTTGFIGALERDCLWR